MNFSHFGLPLLLFLALCCAVSDTSAEEEKTASVVYAVKQIHNGKTIKKSDVAVKSVPASSLPPRLLLHKEADMTKVESFYEACVSEVVGRVSKGIRKGQILYFNWPGFRGPTVVLAIRDIAPGSVIERNSVEEHDINPNDISPAAAEGFWDVVGKKSNGIKKGQIVTWVRGESGFRSGEVLGPLQGKPYASAVREIRKGALITRDDFETGSMRYRRWSPGDVDSFVEDPEGFEAIWPIQKGQIITKKDVKK